jgi:iron(III) transport system permease protein
LIAREITFDHLTLQHYRAVFHNSMFVNSIWTSIFASATAVLILIPLGFACAFALRYDAAGPKPLRWLIEVLVPVAVPASLMGFGVLFAYTQSPFELYGTRAIIVVTYVTLMIGHSTRWSII